MLDLILIRHGATVWNEESRYQGWSDLPLSERGRAQICGTGRCLHDIGFAPDLVVASDLLRAQQTAGILFQDRPVQTDARLREMDFGFLEGRTYEEGLRDHGTVFQNWIENPESGSPPGGESFIGFRSRVLSALADLPSGTKTALIGHGGPIRLLISLFLSLSFREGFRPRVRPGGLVRLTLSSVEVRELRERYRAFPTSELQAVENASATKDRIQ